MMVPSLSQAASSMATRRSSWSPLVTLLTQSLAQVHQLLTGVLTWEGEIAFQVRNPLFAAVLGLHGRSAVVRGVLRASQPLGEPLVWTLSGRGERSGHDVEECLREARSRA